MQNDSKRLRFLLSKILLMILACIMLISCSNSDDGKSTGTQNLGIKNNKILESSQSETSQSESNQSEPALQEPSPAVPSLSEQSDTIGSNNVSSSGELAGLAEKYGYGSDQDSSSKIDKFNKEYLQCLAPSDDEYDYKWANDYNKVEMAKLIVAQDSACYEEIFGFKKPTLADIEEAVEDSDGIAEKYKEHIIRFVSEWLSFYPDTDFSVLMQNLKTLKVIEVNNEQMMWAALSPTAVACYRPNENEIYVNVNINLSDKTNDDTIVFRHEFIHAARTTKTKIGGYSVRIGSYSGDNMGLYYDEAVMTNLLYQIQGFNQKSQFYKMASNYYRIIQDCIGDSYTGSDYFNHSINYFASKMDEYMGDTDYALHILSLIDVQMNKHYKKYLTVDITDFSELYEYITRMYMKKYLEPGMTDQEKEKVFQNFVSELTASWSKTSDKYEGIEEASFRPFFEKICTGEE